MPLIFAGLRIRTEHAKLAVEIYVDKILMILKPRPHVSVSI